MEYTGNTKGIGTRSRESKHFKYFYNGNAKDMQRKLAREARREDFEDFEDVYKGSTDEIQMEMRIQMEYK